MAYTPFVIHVLTKNKEWEGARRSRLSLNSLGWEVHHAGKGENEQTLVGGKNLNMARCRGLPGVGRRKKRMLTRVTCPSKGTEKRTGVCNTPTYDNTQMCRRVRGNSESVI